MKIKSINPFRSTNSNSDNSAKSISATKGWKSISSTAILLISAPLFALFMTAHVFHSYEVDGLSMANTLQDNDRLIVYKLPKTISNITGGEYLPDRGDIVVFDRPRQLTGKADVSHLIKRVIALPGERVTVRDGTVTVYNGEAIDGFNPDHGTDYENDITRTPGNVDITVGPEEVFVLGDNRFNSSDSRVFGTVSTDTIVGTAEIRFLPTNAMRRL